MRVVEIALLSILVIFASHSKLNTAEKNVQSMDSSHERIILGYLNSFNKIRKPRAPPKIANKSENVTAVKSLINPKVALVKKPIPKFADTDSSEEDYQMKMRSPIKYSDSMEHEDEDFNLDDYEFDVHHDEFAGRGKPLQPRIKVKINSRRTEHLPVKTDLEGPKPQIKQSKIKPRQVRRPSNKVASKAIQVIKEDEYYDGDDISTSTKPSGKERKFAAAISEEDISNESKEHEGKSSVRTIRSPINFSNYMDKLGEKTSALMSKILSYLPIFPQIQLSKN